MKKKKRILKGIPWVPLWIPEDYQEAKMQPYVFDLECPSHNVSIYPAKGKISVYRNNPKKEENGPR